MQFLADENVEWPVVLYLRKQGYDVLAVKEISAGSSDDVVMSLAEKENRIILTNDLDFGRLVLQKNKDFPGVVLMRLAKESSRKKIEVLEHLLKFHKDKLPGHLTVIDEKQIRIRPLMK